MMCPMRKIACAAVILLTCAAVYANVPSKAPPSRQTVAFDLSECQTCHADTLLTFGQTHHSKVTNSCSQCHGDVAAHAKSMMEGEGKGPVRSVKDMPVEERNDLCLSCHDKGRQANWHGGKHDRRDVACTSCHSVHHFKSRKAYLRTERDSDTCFTCHQNIRSQSMRTSHHPVREGKMGCTSCHDPHNGTRPRMIKAASVNELCYSCHTEKRGPFLWEHAPVRENCMSCHNPHGSNHEKLLVAKTPYLCQRCHLNTRHPGTLYQFSNVNALGPSPSNRALEHSCRNCHQNIHGTNAPSGPYLGR